MMRRSIFALAVVCLALPAFALASVSASQTVASSATASPARRASQLLHREIQSAQFTQNKIGVSPNRAMVVYLPKGYEQSKARYPVLYFLPSPLDSYEAPFAKNGAQGLLDRATQAGVMGEFILICVDMTTPLGSSWYVNSPVTGNWENFVVQELVPYVDKSFRTLPSRDSRGIVGDFMGGYGALRFGMTHPDVFGSVYALHPVGTGSGLLTMYSRPNWDTMAHVKFLDDVKADMLSRIFTSIYQAHVFNVAKPPLYIDLQAHKEGDTLNIDSAVTARLRDNFLLESLVPRYADNLKSLRGLKFDWARSDPNQDHVYSNQAFTHKLNEFGVVHEAEEYNGVWGDGNWGENGRIYTEVLPFFQRNLRRE